MFVIQLILEKFVFFRIVENRNDDIRKGNITERLASNRQVKFNELWTELLNKISEINQVFTCSITLIHENSFSLSSEFITQTGKDYSSM